MASLVSLHLPKTAGSSFFQVLCQSFGDDCMKDYADLPVNTPCYKRNGKALLNGVLNGWRREEVACVHGHFLPLKYRFLPSARYITWMREPAERMVSHYYYWLRNYNPDEAGYMHARVVEENWSLERFCFSPEFRNVYKQFLWGFPLGKFDFIGITEFYEQDLRFFCKKFLMCDLPKQGVFLNENPDREGRSYFDDNVFYSEVKAFHAEDYAIYNQATRLRNSNPERCCG